METSSPAPPPPFSPPPPPVRFFQEDERGARVLSIPAAGFRVGAWASSAAEGTSSSSAPLPPRQFVAYCAWSAGGGDASLYLAPKRRALAVCYGAVKVMIEEWSR